MILLSSLVALRLMLVLLLLFEPAFPVEEVAAGRSSTTTPNDGELLKRRVLRSRGGGGGNNNNKQVKIFILAGGDNMLGYASLPHLRALVQREADHNSKNSNKDNTNNHSASTTARKKQKQQQQKHYLYTHLVDGQGNWRIRDNVFVVHEGQQAAGIQASPYHFGPLDPKGGFGAAIHRFGPELEFGHVMGNVYARDNNPVVLVKAAWSGRKTTLARDFRSPSSPSSSSSTGKTTGTATTAGFQWFRLLSNLQWTVDHLGDILGAAHEESSSSYEQEKPKHQHYKLMGVIWWHGYRDLQDPMAVMEYHDNLVHFCRDIRRTFRDPYLPILIGELGGRGRLQEGNASMTKPEREEFEFRQMQRQAVQALSPMTSNNNQTTSGGTATATTRFVPTARFVKKRASPQDVRMLFHENATHYYGRADTMIDVGRAFATQFLDMTYNNDQVGRSGSGGGSQASSSSSSSKGAMETFFRNKDMNFRLRLMIYVILSLMVLVLGFAFCSQGGFTPSNVQDSFKTTVRLFAEGQAGEEDDNDDDNDDDQEYDEDHVEVVSFDKDGEVFVEEEVKDSS